MKVEQFSWKETLGWTPGRPGDLGSSADLVLVFSDASVPSYSTRLHEIQEAYPNAKLIGCSTFGGILDTQILDDAIAITAISFEHTSLQESRVCLDDIRDSYEAGMRLARSLDPNGLVHAFALADGVHDSAVQFVTGIREGLPPGVKVTGGLAGTRTVFADSFCIANGLAAPRTAGIIGLYSNKLTVGYGALSGWRAFGPHRLVTRASGSELFELDGRSALGLYREYLGDFDSWRPQATYLYPLQLRRENQEEYAVRAIMSVNDERQSLFLAGEVTVGCYTRLMRGSHDDVIDGAVGAAETALNIMGTEGAELAILVSCAARKVALKQRCEEELEAVREVFGPNTCFAGFYSHGEIGPNGPGAESLFHNQTMTITALREN